MSKRSAKAALANENKHILEKRLYDAKMSPDRKFDLSACNLTTIPDGIFSLCKVFKKDALYLHNNQLKGFANGGPMDTLLHLKVLDISYNRFEKLPNDLHLMENLEVLNASQNLLKQLPETIGFLNKLRVLIVSNNNLVMLPDTLGNCSNLEILNLESNKNLRKLPVTLAKLKSLWQLDLDANMNVNMVFPPNDVCREGIQAILSYLSNELKNLPETSSLLNIDQKKNLPGSSLFLQEELEQFEEQKKKKQMEMVTAEKMNWEQKEKEVAVEHEHKKKQERLIKAVEKQQKTMDEKISKVQEDKDAERNWLIKHCLEEEEKSDQVVGKILAGNKKLRSENVEALELEKKQEEEWLSQTLSKGEIDRKQLLASMDQDLKEEVKKAQMMTEQKRVFVIRSLVTELLSQDNSLRAFLGKTEKTRSKGVEIVRDEEIYQKSAVAAMLERSDASSWKLSKQIAIVEEELMMLTRLEIMKKKLQSDSHIEELEKNRIALTEELMRLFKEQDERRKKLVETVRKMEGMKENSTTFWVDQYGKLKNSKSYRMVEFLESVPPTLAHEFFLNGVLQHLPLFKHFNFSRENLMNLDANALTKLGIKSTKDKAAIIKAVKAFLESDKFLPIKSDKPVAVKSDESTSGKAVNSVTKFWKHETKVSRANEVEKRQNEVEKRPTIEPSKSPSYSLPEECVICFDRKPIALFIPCGHICCCEKCCRSLTLCPLCRQPISEIYETTQQP